MRMSPAASRRFAALQLLAAICLAAACGGAGEASYQDVDSYIPPVDTTVQRSTPAGAERAGEIEGFLTIEGTREPMTFRLFRTPDAFPLAFETYLPEDVVAEPLDAGDGQGVAFRTMFGGEGGAGRISLHVPETQPDAGQARRLVAQVAGELGAAERVEAGGFTWALEEFRFAGGHACGSVALGRHDGVFFYIVTSCPREMEEGFGPRIARILGEWRWADGSRLGS
jgi:hypothetical protein